jgi:hypothetical protein
MRRRRCEKPLKVFEKNADAHVQLVNSIKKIS